MKLNNKGYMLVEIVLASFIAMMVAYLMFNLTIKLKNKNDDLLVLTLVKTDAALMENEIMRGINLHGKSFNCSYINISGNKFTYNDGLRNYSFDINNYATISNITCNVDASYIQIKIPISVSQLENNFDIDIKYKL